jgi:Large-conductance mechanosensitive channel, MscL
VTRGILATRKRVQITSKENSPSVMRRISGRCQRGIRYALWTLGEATTMEILENCYTWPCEDRRQRKNQATAWLAQCVLLLAELWPMRTSGLAADMQEGIRNTEGFKNFLMRDDVTVVAVGLVVALAFSNLVKAFTDNIINPLIAAGGAITA